MWKCTHQLEILNATDEVGGVGPPALDVHTICTQEETGEDVHRDVVSAHSAPVINGLFCPPLPG